MFLMFLQQKINEKYSRKNNTHSRKKLSAAVTVSKFKSAHLTDFLHLTVLFKFASLVFSQDLIPLYTVKYNYTVKNRMKTKDKNLLKFPCFHRKLHLNNNNICDTFRLSQY